MLSKDPTKTAPIERKWNREINKRWAVFKKQVFNKLSKPSISVNKFDIDSSEMRSYMVYWQERVDSILIGDWQSKYQKRAYLRAIERGRQQLIAQGVKIEPTAEEILVSKGFNIETRLTALSAIDNEAILFLTTRSYEALKQWTDDMTRKVRIILTDGVKSGKGINELKREISKQLDVSKRRAQLIARTETIQAYQRSTINHAELLGAELGKTVKLRWVTVADGRVRHQHAFWHGKLMTPKEVFRNIQISPFNCRCGQIETVIESEKDQKKWDKERQHLLAVEKATNK